MLKIQKTNTQIFLLSFKTQGGHRASLPDLTEPRTEFIPAINRTHPELPNPEVLLFPKAPSSALSPSWLRVSGPSGPHAWHYDGLQYTCSAGAILNNPTHPKQTKHILWISSLPQQKLSACRNIICKVH